MFRALVEEDKLFYRIQWSRLSPEVDENFLGRQEEALSRTFCSAFHDVWSVIPAPDRITILNYWAADEQLFRATRQEPFIELPPRPLVEIVDDLPTFTAECVWCGFDLRFPVLLIMKCSHRLPYEIAHVLAQVYNITTAKSGELYTKMVDKPMDRWQKRHPDAAPDVSDQRLFRLEAEHDRKYGEVIAEIVRRWGVTPPKEEGSVPRRYY